MAACYSADVAPFLGVARAAVEVEEGSLAGPVMLVEIEVTAVRP